MTASPPVQEPKFRCHKHTLLCQSVCVCVCASVNPTWDFRTGEDDFVHLDSLLRGGEIVSVDRDG